MRTTPGSGVCSGTIEIKKPVRDPNAPGYWNAPPPQEISVPCEWKGRFHLPVGIFPAVVAFLLVGCLLGCYRKNKESMEQNRRARFTELEAASPRGDGPSRGGRAHRMRESREEPRRSEKRGPRLLKA